MKHLYSSVLFILLAMRVFAKGDWLMVLGKYERKKVVCSILELTTQHGDMSDKTQSKTTKFYNLDAIIADNKNILFPISISKATNPL